MLFFVNKCVNGIPYFFLGHYSVLLHDVKNTQRQAYAQGTFKNLLSQWKAYFLFCTYFDINPYDITVVNLCVYVQFLSRSLKCYTSVLNYLGSIKSLFALMGIDYPIYTPDLKLTLRGLKRVMAAEVKQAQPIDPLVLADIFKVIDISNPQDVTYWCAFLFMYYLMFRSSQLFPKSLKSPFVDNI